MAASFTEAMPSITSPSDGMVSPASTMTTSPTFRLVPGTVLYFSRPGPVSSLAWVSVRVLRSESACALPRPSAIASEKFANKTVNHSHSTIWNSKPICSPPVTRSRSKMIVVSAVTTSSTNMTGFLIRVRGSSFTKADPMAGTTILTSKSADTGMRLRMSEVSMEVTPKRRRSECCLGNHREMLDDRTKRERRKEGEAADDHDHPDDEPDEQAAGRREGSGGSRDRLLGYERTGDRHCRNDHPEAADEHRDCPREIVEHRVGGDASESRSVVVGARSVEIEHL